MATHASVRGRRTRRTSEIHKPNGAIHPRVQDVGPEHFGIVSCDCAKARSKWMLTDFYGNILISPIELPHRKPDLQAAIEQIRAALAERQIHDLIVAVERTGRYHLVVKDAFTAADFDVRIVHPYATKQFRQPADPGNKTDDTDLAAIFRATVNGFGLVERPLDSVHGQLQLLARHRRDLVRKNAAVRCQIRDHLNLFLPGYEDCFADPFASEVALIIARRLGSPRAIRQAGVVGLERLLRDGGVHFKASTLERLITWAERAPDAPEDAPVHQRIVIALDDDRLAKRTQIAALERDLAALLARTPYLLLLSIPGINVVSAAEFAGEMGPIGNYLSSRSITRRAGLVPSRHQSDEVDRPNGPLLRCGNRNLRQAILTIADHLMTCNEHFRELAQQWRQAGKAPQHSHVRVAGRFCRIAYQMVAGGRVFEHPCCRRRDYILSKMLKFQCEHDMPMDQAQGTLASAVEQLPHDQRPAEASPLVEELEAAASRRGRGPCLIGELLPAVLAKLGVNLVESTSSGE
jgi:transposase